VQLTPVSLGLGYRESVQDQCRKKLVFHLSVPVVACLKKSLSETRVSRELSEENGDGID